MIGLRCCVSLVYNMMTCIHCKQYFDELIINVKTYKVLTYKILSGEKQSSCKKSAFALAEMKYLSTLGLQ